MKFVNYADYYNPITYVIGKIVKEYTILGFIKKSYSFSLKAPKDRYRKTYN